MKSKVFILYTGGTFGMKNDLGKGLQPSSWEEIIDYLPAREDRTFFDYFADVDFTFETLNPVVDSSNMEPANWERISRSIATHYDDHDGFIVIHGTDTLAYTASALSFVFKNLQKPIVLTGAQLPIFHPRTDGIVNLSNAIYIAGYQQFNLPCIPEVIICFNDRLLRGNRAVKTSTNDFEGFSSPNFPLLGALEQHISIDIEHVLPLSGEALDLHSSFSKKVVNVTVFPGFDAEIMIRLVKQGGLEGIVLKTFGSGNLPDEKIWTTLFDTCYEHNVLVLATTQCPNGSIEIGRYSASNVLDHPAVVSGNDLTPEAALTKLMWVIGNFEKGERAEILGQNLRGEINTHK